LHVYSSVSSPFSLLFCLFNHTPTSYIYTLSLHDALPISNVLKNEAIFIISDEIYAENTFNNKHTSFAEFESIRDQLLLVNGLSKSHSATGIRIGFLLGPEYLIEKLTRSEERRVGKECRYRWSK